MSNNQEHTNTGNMENQTQQALKNGQRPVCE